MDNSLQLLISALGSEDAYERSVAAEALGNLGPDAAPAVKELIRCAKDRDPEVAYLAGQALARVGTEEANQAVRKFTVPALVKRLKHPDYSERSDAAMSLGELGQLAEGSELELQQLFLEPMSEPALHAARALRSIGTPKSMAMFEQFADQWQEVFIEQLLHDDEAVRDFACFGLKLLDTPAARKALEIVGVGD
ncbi:MAG: HEAT repeat domain-containing protein [Bdellovibrionales bacterium]|nr:HEAT repeat domain-containing protein [Bdellovibrionales bacterium]